MYRSIIASLILILSAAPAGAEPVAEEDSNLGLGVQAGLVLPQLQSELGTTYGVQANAGYRVVSHLSAFVGLGYSKPSVTVERSDPRLEADYRSTTTQRELTITAGALWRLLPTTSPLNAYGGAGLRFWQLETLTNGVSGGEQFLDNEETSTRVGAALMAGGEYRLGPGAAVVELDVGGSDLPHLITGDVATTAVSFMAGYRLLL